MTEDRGSVSTFGAAMIGLVLVAGLVALEASTLVADRIALQTAADAVALAVAPATFPAIDPRDPVEVAMAVARANGSELVRCRCRIDPSRRIRTVAVVVRRTRRLPLFEAVAVTAGASAEFDPMAAIGGIR